MAVTQVINAVDLGPLAPLFDDDAVTDVLVNGVDDVWVERGGELTRTGIRFATSEEVMAVIWRIAASVGRRVSFDQPLLDARLADGSRVNAVLPPVSLSGPVLTIRRFRHAVMSAEQLVALGSLTGEALDFLHGCVRARRTIVVSGGSSSGKTTLLNVLGGFCDERERVVTIEDAAELALRHAHWLRLESRPADVAGREAITMRDLVRNALRMRPDRIILGEVRGGEALDMLQAMSTGQDGSMTTIHANDTRDALNRMEMLVLMGGIDLPSRSIIAQLARCLHIVVHLERTRSGERRVARVSEVSGREGDVILLQDIFVRDAARGDALVPTRLRPRAVDQMVGVRQALPEGLRSRYRELIGR